MSLSWKAGSKKSNRLFASVSRRTRKNTTSVVSMVQIMNHGSDHEPWRTPTTYIYIYISFWTAAAKHLSLCCSAASISIPPRPWPMCSSSTLARATGWATQGHQSPPILANRKGEHAREEITSSERRRTVWEKEKKKEEEEEEEKKKKKKTRWAREPKSMTAHSTPFFENFVVWAAVLCTKST